MDFRYGRLDLDESEKMEETMEALSLEKIVKYGVRKYEQHI